MALNRKKPVPFARLVANEIIIVSVEPSGHRDFRGPLVPIVDDTDLRPNDPPVATQIDQLIFLILAQRRGDFQRSADNGIDFELTKRRATLSRRTKQVHGEPESGIIETAAPRRCRLTLHQTLPSSHRIGDQEIDTPGLTEDVQRPHIREYRCVHFRSDILEL